MPCHIVGGHGGPGQDEGPVVLRVDGGSHLIPYSRGKLPLIDEPWTRSVEETGGVQFCELQCRRISVKLDAAIRKLSSCYRLPAGARAFEYDRARVCERTRKLGVNDSRPVRRHMATLDPKDKKVDVSKIRKPNI